MLYALFVEVFRVDMKSARVFMHRSRTRCYLLNTRHKYQVRDFLSKVFFSKYGKMHSAHVDHVRRMCRPELYSFLCVTLTSYTFVTDFGDIYRTEQTM